MIKTKIQEKLAIETKQHILGILPDDQMLKDFSSIFIESMSTGLISKFHQNELVEFLQDRFNFLKQSINVKSAFKFYKQKRNNRHVLELLWPEAKHIVITLSELFRKYDIHVTCNLHPTMAIGASNGDVTSISIPSEEDDLFNQVYIEFEETESEEVIEKLKEMIPYHMEAVQLAHLGQDRILEKLDEVKGEITKNDLNTAEPTEEWLFLIDWLKTNCFFSGYTAFTIDKRPDEALIENIKDSSLGILSATDEKKEPFLNTLNAHIWSFLDFPYQCQFDVVNTISPLQRFEKMMRLSVKIPQKNGTVISHNFLGLLKLSSKFAKCIETPLIRVKMMHVFESKKMITDSFDYDEVIRIFNAIPKYELFRTSQGELLEIVDDLLQITNPNRVHCYFYKTMRKNKVRLVVGLSDKLFSSENIQLIIDHLKAQAPYIDHEYIKVKGNETSRLHVYFQLHDEQSWTPDLKTLEAEISDLIEPWEEKVHNLLYDQNPSAMGEMLSKRYINAFPKYYRVRSNPKQAVRDILFLEKLAHSNSIQFNITEFTEHSPKYQGQMSLLHVYNKEKVDLINIMPIFQNLGLHVVDELITQVGTDEENHGYIQSFRVIDTDREGIDIKAYKPALVELLESIFNEKTENDALNGLVLKAGFNWRAINLLQTYRNLFFQVFAKFRKGTVNRALLNHSRTTKLLLKYFETKFSINSKLGEKDYRLKVLLPQIQKDFIESLGAVENVNDDRILRRIFNLIDATLRTNYFIEKANNESFISLKIDSSKVKGMVQPVPYREIYVHDVGLEGVHLRFGSVARGGLRWSDRNDDFRTEILGLVKTQQTKNVVIVPVGSKGGFVVKKQHSDRQATMAEAHKQYKKFIGGLLDITDNIDKSGQVIHPHIMIYDQPDPYLVVAADKGTATFSDMANEVSQNYNFWLGDAFASGGSMGYDHKKEGITARGAWECVKLHFKELGKDLDADGITAAGIGDMSGDVFGNGMLLSKNVKLQAAFNHMHIFLDPNPDPKVSWEERKRLFDLPRSTWKDYAADLISSGGGVFDRYAKEIHLSKEAKALLNVQEDALTGEEVIRAILKMQTDLLWFGGIGTYIKATHQSSLDAGDLSNEAVRINASECNAKVIGEGANLGLTQLARLEFNQNGGKINTDAIDNSAGVNMSDYEVNIKILLQKLLQEKVLKSQEERNAVLEHKPTIDMVSELVLKNNRAQHRLISQDQIRSIVHFKKFRGLIQYLEKYANLDVLNENIPDMEELDMLDKTGNGLPRPALAVLQAYVKMHVYEELLKTDLPNDPFLTTVYSNYFPESLQEKFGKDIFGHQLTAEIISTVLTNKIVNQGGMSFYYRVSQKSGRSIEEITRAYLVIEKALRGEEYRTKISSLTTVTEEEKYKAIIEFENILRLMVEKTLQMAEVSHTFDQIEKYQALLDSLKKSITLNEDESIKVEQLKGAGFPENIAKDIVTISKLKMASDVLYLSEKNKMGISNAIALNTKIEELFDFSKVRQLLLSIPLLNDWELAHQDILMQTLETYKRKVVKFVIEIFVGKDITKISSEELIDPLEEQFPGALKLYFQTIEDLNSNAPVNLTTLSVSIHRLNFIDMI